MATNGRTWRLALCKRYLLRAEDRLASGDVFASAEGVVAAQDGLELLLAVLAEAQNVAILRDDSFVGMLRKVSEKTAALAPFTKSMTELNHLRVGVKHNGTLPDEREARRLVASSLHAARQLCTSVLSSSFDAVRIADGLSHRLVSALLAEAEAHLETWDSSGSETFENTLAEALEFLRAQSRALFNVGVRTEALEPRIRNQAGTRSSDVLTIAKMVDAALDGFRAELVFLHAGVPRTDVSAWARHLPTVNIALAGNVYVVRSSGSDVDVSVATARYLFLSILSFAERLDQLERTSQPAAPSTLVRATRDTTAVYGTTKARELADLRSGAMYETRGRASDDTTQQILCLFGLDARAPADAFEPVK